MDEVAKKGQELVTFKQKHGIKLVDERDTSEVAATKSGDSETAGGSKGSTVASAAAQGVLVSK